MKMLFMVLFLSFALFAKAQKGTTTFSISYGSGDGKIKPIKFGLFIYPQVNIHTIGIGLAESHIAF